MSDLLNSASLVMIPSGYKEDVVYSQIPTDGSGDLSFTRASNGTRVNSAGLVEVAPWNLTDYSEDFSNGFWTKSNTTITTNATTAPNGTTTADKVISSAVNDEHLVYYFASQYFNQVVTLSAYVKKSDYRYAILRSYTNSAYRISVFDLDNGVIASQDLGTSTIESVGNGWYRISTTFTTPGSTFSYQYAFSATQTFVYAGDGTSGNFLWGAQVNIGSTAKPYFPTTDRLNVPRLTYQNGGGGCPSLLLEKQSTNQILYSEQVDNSTWLKGGISVTANNTTSPDGTQNADKVTNTNTSSIYLYQKSQISASTWSYSFYAKKGTNKYLGISLCSETYQATSRYQPVFNLDDGTLQTINQSGSNETNTSYSINTVGNGWYKITASITFSAGADFCYVVFQSSNNTSYSPSSGFLDWQTATTGDYYIWGIQGEASSYPTSYIPTTSSSATRVADACYKTGISSLIGQTEGVLFVDVNRIQKSQNYNVAIFIGLWPSVIDVYFDNSNQLICVVYNSGVLQTTLNGGVLANGRHKIAVAYKQNDFVMYVDGTQVATSSSGSVPTCSQLIIGNDDSTLYHLNDSINEAVIFPTRLTNAELASLTTI